MLHDLHTRRKNKLDWDVGGQKKSECILFSSLSMLSKDSLHWDGKQRIGDFTCLCLVAATEDGFDWRKWVHKLLDFHTVSKDHCCVTGWRCHDDTGAVQQFDVFVQMHFLKAPESNQPLLWGKRDTHRKSRCCGIISSLRTYLVTPGVAPTLQARALFRLLIKLLFPTLGNPVDKIFTLEKKSTQTSVWCATPLEAYRQHQLWWLFLCPGYGNSCRGASSGNRHPNKHCY